MLRIDELKEKLKSEPRHFVDLPEVIFFDDLSDHIEELFGAEIVEYEIDGVVGIWIEFAFREHMFYVDNHLGDFRFFVTDPKCPDEILMEIANHLRLLLEKGAGVISDDSPTIG